MPAPRRPFPFASWLCAWALSGVGCGQSLVPAAADAGGTAAPCSGSAVLCARGCTRKELQQQICRNGEWVCLGGLVNISGCPPDSCARSEVSCCDPTTGAIQRAPCGADDRYEACPSGTRLLGPVYECFPPDAGVTSCAQLAGTCASEALRCASDSPTFIGAIICECKAVSGAPMWGCLRVID